MADSGRDIDSVAFGGQPEVLQDAGEVKVRR